jgi:hypothetical protein
LSVYIHWFLLLHPPVLQIKFIVSRRLLSLSFRISLFDFVDDNH